MAVRTLARVARLLERSCTPMTLAQYRVLTRIAAGEARASRISEQLLVAKPTVSAAIDALVAAGYLDRSADPDDRRAVGLAVTAAGVEALSTAEDAMAERLGPVLAGIADLGPFRDGCDAINAELDARFAARTSEPARADRGRGPTVSAATTTSDPAPAVDDAPRGWVRQLLSALRPHRRNVWIAVGAASAGQLIAALTPLVQRHIIDDGIIAGTAPIAPWIIVLALSGVARFAAAFVRRFWAGRVSLDVQNDLRTQVYDHLQRLDVARHDQMATGQLVSRSISDVNLIQGLLAFLPIVIANVLFFVVALVIMAAISPMLTVVALAISPLLLITSFRLRTRVFPANWDAQQQTGVVAGVVEESVSGVRVVKGFGQEEREVRRLAEAADGLYGRRVRTIRLQARYQPFMQTLPALGQVAVLGLGGWLAIDGRITLGTFLAFSTYVSQLQAPARMLAGLVTIGQQARAGVERVFDLLASTPAVQEAPDAPDLEVAVGEVVLDDVRFGYLSTEPVLDHLTLRVAPGETMAVVGTSGSGKSTLAGLLPRFYDLQGGAIRIDGTDVSTVTLDSLRRSIGLVFEDSFLFSDTIRGNIAYGRPDATDAEVERAARTAGAHEFVSALAEGYDTPVGERGLTLSGGQRQRIALARAIITDPRVLVLDDATSAVDSRIEAEIHATLHEVLENRTTVLIAHRRSTLQLADRIAVLDAGRVVDVGTHEELDERCALYRLLLSGPGDDVEGEDAPAPAAIGAVAGNGSDGPDEVIDPFALDPALGVTPGLWQRDGRRRRPPRARGGRAQGDGHAVARRRHGRRGRRPGCWAGWPRRPSCWPRSRRFRRHTTVPTCPSTTPGGRTRRSASPASCDRGARSWRSASRWWSSTGWPRSPARSSCARGSTRASPPPSPARSGPPRSPTSSSCWPTGW